MQKKVIATTIANLQVEEGKAYAKFFDTEVTWLGVRENAKGVASFIFEKLPAGSGVANQITLGLNRYRNICRTFCLFIFGGHFITQSKVVFPTTVAWQYPVIPLT